MAETEGEILDGSPSLGLWKTLEESEPVDYRVFRVREVDRVSPRTGVAGRYQVLRMPDWANVIALTPEGDFVLVEQYRHGTDRVTFEIAGGCIEKDEDPAVGAARELREETGFEGDPPILIGTVEPNPALQNNSCTTWLIRNARRTGDLALDPGEHIAVHCVSRDVTSKMLADGRIRHALVVAAFHWLEIWERDSRE